MTCKGCKAEMPEGGKFCGECGEQGEDTMAKATCPGCGAEGFAASKFCGECGNAMAKALGPAEYDAGMQAIEALAKANSKLDDELLLGGAGDDPDDDADPDDDGADDDGDEIRKGALPDGLEAVDAAPLIKALLAANNRLAKGVRQVGREARAARKDSAVLAKGVSMLMATNKTLQEQVADLGDQRRGPRTVNARMLAKSTVPPGKGPQPDPKDLNPMQIMAKARELGQGGHLNSSDVSRLEMYAQVPMTLSSIREENPTLAARFEAASSAAAH